MSCDAHSAQSVCPAHQDVLLSGDKLPGLSCPWSLVRWAEMPMHRWAHSSPNTERDGTLRTSMVWAQFSPRCIPFGARGRGFGYRRRLDPQEQVPGPVPRAGLAAQPGPDVSQMLLTSCLAPPCLAFYVLVCFGLQTK